MFRRGASIIILLLASSALLVASDSDENLPAPIFKASLVCFNGKIDSRSSCDSGMAKIEAGLRITNGTLNCGSKGAVSAITWTYLGQKDGKDVYHVVRKFPADTDNAKSAEIDIDFDGKRQVLFRDQSQCIVIETQRSK